ncbi:2-deoxy-D-gluconate 3-dehydrogenase [Betaproteobacteria bacterium GR16-43]|nr:2-deoxy-D-gluconate 3-dehydrogenase [Betaproteobacteria bacterium GR16-43]
MQADRFDVKGRVALVTGASSGLGESFARSLAQSGAIVVAAARRQERLAKLVAEISAAGGKAHAVSLDVADPKSVEAAFATIVKTIGVPQIVVNNAGIGSAKPAIDLTEEDWRSMMATNLDGAFRVAQAAAKAMVAAKKPGSIVNIASILGLRVANNLASYATAKAGLVQLTKALALEWARYGVRVNAIAPGYVETEMNQGMFDTEAGQALIKRVPMRRIGVAGELEGALFLLASDAGSYMTGSVITVDGGHSTNSL